MREFSKNVLFFYKLGNVKDLEAPEHHSGSNIYETHHVPISAAKVTLLQAVSIPLYPLAKLLTSPNLLSPRAKGGGFLYFTHFVFFYKIGEGMNTACKSVTFAAEIGIWLDSHRLDLY